MSDHLKLISRYSTARTQTKVQTPSVEMFHDLLDAIRPVPPIIDEQHLMRLKKVAAYLGIADDDYSEEVCAPEPVVPVKPFTYRLPRIWRLSNDIALRIRKSLRFYPFAYKLGNITPKLTTIGQNLIGPQLTQLTEKKFVQKSAITIAKEIAPHTPPSRASDTSGALRDSQIAQSYQNQESSGRDVYAQPDTDDSDAQQTLDIVRTAIRSIPTLFNRQVDATGTSTAHLVSSDLVFGQSADFASIAANQEFIRRKKLEDAQATTDFKARRPNILCVSDYIFSGSNKGQLIAWRKVNQSAGYIIKRINIVTGKESTFTLFNEELEARYEHVAAFVRAYIVPFYDIAFGNVIAFLDESVVPDALYVYKVTAFQTFVDSRTSVFITTLAQGISLNAKQRLSIVESLAEDDDSIYPALAHRLLGDRRYDWLLAGINIRASISRRDDRSVTRKYAYLDSKPDFIFSQMDSGKLLVPNDVGVVIKTISNAISSFGVVNVLTDIFRDTGILYTFEGIDPAEDGEFKKPTISNDETRFMGIVSSAIDGDTMLVNLRTLVTNLTKFLGGGISNQKDSLGLAVSTRASVERIDMEPIVPTFVRNPRTELGNLDDVVDLHTFEGISRLIRTIRIVSDIGPARN